MGPDKNGASTHDRSMVLSSTLSWLVDAAAEAAGADRVLAELGAHLHADGLPLAGGALTLAVPHPLIARRTWLWRADSREVIEALGFAPSAPVAVQESGSPNNAGRRWLATIAAGVVHEDAIGPNNGRVRSRRARSIICVRRRALPPRRSPPSRHALR
jgi:adenylate cyclase